MTDDDKPKESYPSVRNDGKDGENSQNLTDRSENKPKEDVCPDCEESPCECCPEHGAECPEDCEITGGEEFW